MACTLKHVVAEDLHQQLHVDFITEFRIYIFCGAKCRSFKRGFSQTTKSEHLLTLNVYVFGAEKEKLITKASCPASFAYLAMVISRGVNKPKFYS